MRAVATLAASYKLPVFAVTDGASVTRNEGCEAVRKAREAHAAYEKSVGGDPNEDWLKKTSARLPLPTVE